MLSVRKHDHSVFNMQKVIKITSSPSSIKTNCKETAPWRMPIGKHFFHIVAQRETVRKRHLGESLAFFSFTIFALSAGFLLTKINIGKTGNQNPPQGGLWLPAFPILIF